MIRERAPAPYAPELAIAQPTPTMADTLRKIWRHRGIVIWGTICTAIVVTVVVKMIPASYLAEAQVLVSEANGPKLFKDEGGNLPAAPAASDDKVQSERYVVLSRPVAQQAADKLQLIKDPEFNGELRQSGFSIGGLVGRTMSQLIPSSAPSHDAGPNSDTRAKPCRRCADRKVDVAVMGRSDVLSVDAHSKDPDKAALIANTIAETYVAQQRDTKMQTTGHLETYMQDRITDLRKQVEQAEQEVEDYRRQNGLYIARLRHRQSAVD